ncbi:hypothetical protein [Terrabacter sp. MAHUQ-38]|uniref:hypothetical protein n=1 Tax=unclassified Terrabacter TaxID=2630222 RepID=UPI00165E657B|nr:hypothetical protein [Terrabacter sp. MAHUQ-38]MBC9821418.1 hypothetical protein [Terrabacter sp. MAHUQ-38]
MDGDTRGLGSRVMAGLGQPPRRLFVVGGGAAALALLVDRGLRLDVPQPPPPVPTRRPAPDESLLLSAVAGLTRLVAAETEVLSGPEAGATVRRLREVSREQLRVLRGRLTNAGVPTTVIDAAAAARPAPVTTSTGATTGTPAPGSSPTSTAPAAADPVRTRDELAALLDAIGPAEWTALASATAATRELLVAAYAARLAGAVLLGHDVAVLDSPSPVRPAIVARTQPLVYAFEVVAAQSTGEQRRSAESTLAALSHLEVAVSGATSTTPAGWALPFPVTSPADARRLATVTLASAVDAGPELVGVNASPASLEDVARWGANVQALAVDWDLPLAAFPGAAS